MEIAVLGIDLGKNNCNVVAMDAAGRVLFRRRHQRSSLVRLAADLPRCVIAMEACCGAHHLGRVFREQGHEVRLMPPEYVRPYVKAQKNDDRDAEAIAEAATWPTMRFVQQLAVDLLASFWRGGNVQSPDASADCRYAGGMAITRPSHRGV